MSDRMRALFHEGDLAGAVETAAAEDEPCAVALCLVARGSWGAGLFAAQSALAADADDALALWCRAEARLGLGERSRALADWSRILETDPTSRTAWKDRAVLRALQGDRPGALADLERAATLSPDDVVPRLWTALLGGSAEPLAHFEAVPGWSARLAALVLGHATTDDLLALSAQDEDERRRRRCQVHGYAGLLAERLDPARALAHYEACAATEVWTFVTHLWARERLADHRAGRPWV
jgi:tetratricopeptide (TPR) repeat protein